MAVLQMQRFSICAMKKNRKAILEELQALGIMEIDTSIVEDAALRKANTLEVRQGFDKKAVQIDHALEILHRKRLLCFLHWKEELWWRRVSMIKSRRAKTKS